MVKGRKDNLFFEPVFTYKLQSLLLQTFIIIYTSLDFDICNKLLILCPLTVLFKGWNRHKSVNSSADSICIEFL